MAEVKLNLNDILSKTKGIKKEIPESEKELMQEEISNDSIETDTKVEEANIPSDLIVEKQEDIIEDIPKEVEEQVEQQVKEEKTAQIKLRSEARQEAIKEGKKEDAMIKEHIEKELKEARKLAEKKQKGEKVIKEIKDNIEAIDEDEDYEQITSKVVVEDESMKEALNDDSEIFVNYESDFKNENDNILDKEIKKEVKKEEIKEKKEKIIKKEEKIEEVKKTNIAIKQEEIIEKKQDKKEKNNKNTKLLSFFKRKDDKTKRYETINSKEKINKKVSENIKKKKKIQRNYRVILGSSIIVILTMLLYFTNELISIIGINSISKPIVLETKPDDSIQKEDELEEYINDLNQKPLTQEEKTILIKEKIIEIYFRVNNY